MFHSLFDWTSSKYPEDPAVLPIEQILESRALPHGKAKRTAPHRQATNALWICACECWDMAPTWLIYAEPNGMLRWCRVPNHTEPSSIVNAQFWAGFHTDPTLVLNWLQGEASAPTSDDLDAESIRVLGEISSRLIRTMH